MKKNNLPDLVKFIDSNKEVILPPYIFYELESPKQYSYVRFVKSKKHYTSSYVCFSFHKPISKVI